MRKKQTTVIPPAKEMSRYVEEGLKHLRIALTALNSAQIALLNEYWTAEDFIRPIKPEPSFSEGSALDPAFRFEGARPHIAKTYAGKKTMPKVDAKLAKALKMLRRPRGATRKQIYTVLEWPTASIQQIIRGRGKLRIDARSRPYRYYLTPLDGQGKGTRRISK